MMLMMALGFGVEVRGCPWKSSCLRGFLGRGRLRLCVCPRRARWQCDARRLQPKPSLST